MRTARVVLALSFTIASATAALYACSSDSATTDLPTSTTGTDASSSKDTGSTTDQDTGTTPVGDAGSDCGKPAQLFVSQDGGFLCPFSAVGAGGKDKYCSATQECCETPKNTSPSTCENKGTACPVSGSTQWECQGPENCTGGQVCCAHAGDGGAVTVQTDVCGPYLSHFDGTLCKASCAAGELVVCQKSADCPSAGTCTAVKPKGTDIGVCN